MNLKKGASLSVILAGVLWGVISLFVRPLSSMGMSSLQISYVRMLIAAITVFLVLLITDRSKLKIQWRDLWMFVGTGIISVALFNTCYFYAIIHGEASVAVILLYTSPIFILLLSALLFKEKITAKKLIALVLTLLGCVLVSGILGQSVTIAPLVILIGIGSGLFYALYSIFGKLALKKYDSITVTAYTFFFGLIGSFPLGNPINTFQIMTSSVKSLLLCIGIGIVSTILPYFLYTYGLNHMESGKAAILVAVEPIVGALIGMCFYHENSSLVKILGIIFVLCAIILLNIQDKKKDSKEN